MYNNLNVCRLIRKRPTLSEYFKMKLFLKKYGRTLKHLHETDRVLFNKLNIIAHEREHDLMDNGFIESSVMEIIDFEYNLKHSDSCFPNDKFIKMLDEIYTKLYDEEDDIQIL